MVSSYGSATVEIEIPRRYERAIRLDGYPARLLLQKVAQLLIGGHG